MDKTLKDRSCGIVVRSQCNAASTRRLPASTTGARLQSRPDLIPVLILARVGSELTRG